MIEKIFLSRELFNARPSIICVKITKDSGNWMCFPKVEGCYYLMQKPNSVQNSRLAFRYELSRIVKITRRKNPFDKFDNNVRILEFLIPS